MAGVPDRARAGAGGSRGGSRQRIEASGSQDNVCEVAYNLCSRRAAGVPARCRGTPRHRGTMMKRAGVMVRAAGSHGWGRGNGSGVGNGGARFGTRKAATPGARQWPREGRERSQRRHAGRRGEARRVAEVVAVRRSDQEELLDDRRPDPEVPGLALLACEVGRKDVGRVTRVVLVQPGEPGRDGGRVLALLGVVNLVAERLQRPALVVPEHDLDPGVSARAAGAGRARRTAGESRAGGSMASRKAAMRMAHRCASTHFAGGVASSE